MTMATQPFAPQVRPAQPTEAAQLTILALRSKAYWGYDQAFMLACRAELTVTPQRIAAQPTYVLEAGGHLSGFYMLDRNRSSWITPLPSLLALVTKHSIYNQTRMQRASIVLAAQRLLVIRLPPVSLAVCYQRLPLRSEPIAQSMDEDMEILLVRHGENKANITREFSCKTVDYPLTEKGKMQAEQTAEALAKVKIDQIISSPLLRAKQTAEIIGQRTNHNFAIEEELREIDVGDLEVSPPTANAWKSYFAVIHEWNRGNLDQRFAGGESGTALRERFHAVIKKYLALPMERVVFVGHAGIFLNGIAHLCALEKSIEFYADSHHNCSISKIEVAKQLGRYSFALKEWGDIAHLSGGAEKKT